MKSRGKYVLINLYSQTWIAVTVHGTNLNLNPKRKWQHRIWLCKIQNIKWEKTDYTKNMYFNKRKYEIWKFYAVFKANSGSILLIEKVC